MSTVSGVIQYINDNPGRKNKSVKLNGDANYYSFFDESYMEGVRVGDNVILAFKAVHKNGRTFYNLTGPIKLAAGMESSTPAAATTSERPMSMPREPEFPVSPENRQVSIIRQNALGHATQVVINAEIEGDYRFQTFDECANMIVAVARIFEDYASGQGDLRAVKSMLAGKMNDDSGE